jgi:hypothetical protein
LKARKFHVRADARATARRLNKRDGGGWITQVVTAP